MSFTESEAIEWVWRNRNGCDNRMKECNHCMKWDACNGVPLPDADDMAVLRLQGKAKP